MVFPCRRRSLENADDRGNRSLRVEERTPNLQALTFSDGALSDDNLKALRGARSLVDLSLYEANISDVGFAELQRALPNCKIRRWLHPRHRLDIRHLPK